MSEDYEFVTRTAKNQRRKTNNSGVKNVRSRRQQTNTNIHRKRL